MLKNAYGKYSHVLTPSVADIKIAVTCQGINDSKRVIEFSIERDKIEAGKPLSLNPPRNIWPIVRIENMAFPETAFNNPPEKNAATTNP